jgi:hypothetical protein
MSGVSVYFAAPAIAARIATGLFSGDYSNDDCEQVALAHYGEHDMRGTIAHVKGRRIVHVSLINNETGETEATYNFSMH